MRSNLLSYEPVDYLGVFFSHSLAPLGGDEGIRTPDPLLARQVLSQLSYTPIWNVHSTKFMLRIH